MTHPVLTPTSPTKAAHRSPWHRMPFRLASTSSRGMRLRSSSSSIVNRGQSLAYEQQAPQELQAPIGRHVWDLCGAILLPRAPAWRSGHVGPSRRNCRFRTVMRALPSVAARLRRPRGRSSSAAVRATTAVTDCRPVRRWPATVVTSCALTSNTPRRPAAAHARGVTISLGGSVFDRDRLPCHALDIAQQRALIRTAQGQLVRYGRCGAHSSPVPPVARS